MNNVGRKVIGYIRATPGGAKGADKSAEDQEEELKAYAETEGLEFRNRSQILLLMLLCGEDVSSGYSNLGVRCQEKERLEIQSSLNNNSFFSTSRSSPYT